MLTWRSRCPDVVHSTDNPRFGLLYSIYLQHPFLLQIMTLDPLFQVWKCLLLRKNDVESQQNGIHDNFPINPGDIRVDR